MDDLSIDIESLVMGGETTLGQDRVAAEIRVQAGDFLDADTLSRVSRAVVESVRRTAPG